MSSETAQILPVVGANPGTLVEVVPGKKFIPLPVDAVPQVAIAEVVPQGEGTFRLAARICPRWFTIQAKTLKSLGIATSATSMRRLIRAGFIDGRLVTPNIHQFSLPSYLDHLERCRDPEFWSQTESGHKKSNLERLRDVIY